MLQYSTSHDNEGNKPLCYIAVIFFFLLVKLKCCWITHCWIEFNIVNFHICKTPIYLSDVCLEQKRVYIGFSFSKPQVQSLSLVSCTSVYASMFKKILNKLIWTSFGRKRYCMKKPCVQYISSGPALFVKKRFITQQASEFRLSAELSVNFCTGTDCTYKNKKKNKDKVTLF